MSLFKRSRDEFLTELIQILLSVREYITDDSDCVWTYYETSLDMRNEIDKYIEEFKNGSVTFLDEVNMHFLVTSAYQEHSMSNGWSDEYLQLAERFDKVYSYFKPA